MSEELCGQPSNEAEAGYQPMPPATPLPDDDKEQTYSSDERGLAFCDDDGQLDTDLIRKVFEGDTELDAAEQAFWLIHNYKPGFRLSELTGIYKLIYQKSGRLWVWKQPAVPVPP